MVQKSLSWYPQFLSNKKDFNIMSNHTYKMLELTGSSDKGMEDAIQNAVSKASQTVRNMRWFQVMETRGHIDNGHVQYWQVTIKIGFTLED